MGRYPWCMTPTRENVLGYLEPQGKPVPLSEICFCLDAVHGCVWSESRVLRVLVSLEEDGLVKRMEKDEWLSLKQSSASPTS